MLVSLSIRDFVLIEKLDLNFSRSSPGAAAGGLDALTGETENEGKAKGRRGGTTAKPSGER